MAEVKEYKCPCCSAELTFDSGSQKMKCPYCESEFDISTVQDYNEQLAAVAEGSDDMSWETSPGSDWSDGETNGMSIYSCKSCGGEIIADSTTGAASCPYCGNPVVMSGHFSGDLRPDIVIPFKLDKEAAKSALIKHMDGKKLLPKVFREQNHIDEIKGIYVPVWLFDAEADADLAFRCTKVRSWADAQFNYVETKYYQAVRAGKISFANVPVDGSEKMPDDLMESIEPFNVDEAVEFSTAYLSGYLADKYDVTAEQSIERANERIRSSARDAFTSTVRGFDTVTCEGCRIRLNDAKSRYALYPVWILNTTWENNKYIFAMNGQTGKFVGDLPVDRKAYWKWFAIIAVIAFIVIAIGIFMFSGQLNSNGTLGSAVGSVLSAFFGTGSMRSQLKSVRQNSGAAVYEKKNSMQLSDDRDIFLNQKVEKMPRNNSNIQGPGAGGPPQGHGPSVHNDGGTIINIGDLMKK